LENDFARAKIQNFRGACFGPELEQAIQLRGLKSTPMQFREYLRTDAAKPQLEAMLSGCSKTEFDL